MSALAQEVARIVRDVPDFPKPGILFKDIGPLLRDAAALKRVVSHFAAQARAAGAQHIVGIESRGFLFGVPVALELGLPFLPARKKGKLPGPVVGQSYELEYGMDRIELQSEALSKGQRYYVVDDVIATGGTALAVTHLLTGQQCNICGYGFLIELSFLQGKEKLLESASGAAFDSLLRI